MMLNVIAGDALEKLRELPDESVHCCVTSPPYWGLRDYGTAAWEGGEEGCDHRFRDAERDPTSTLVGTSNKEGFALNNYKHTCGKCGAKRTDSQLGLEKTPEEYVAKMVEVFREVRRVLRRDGTLWLNLGDSYAHNGPCGGSSPDGDRAYRATDKAKQEQMDYRVPPGLKVKDLCGIPWRVAFALQADGWWLRSDIIWAKPNPMPESVTDRPTKAHEYLFLLTKSASYFYDSQAILEQSSYGEQHANKATSWGPNGKMAQHGIGKSNRENYLFIGDNHTSRKFEDGSYGRNKRSVWTVATAPYPEAHFATYPPDLIKPCIMAGTSARGCCAKCGAPWERVVEETSEYEAWKNREKDSGGWAKRAGDLNHGRGTDGSGTNSATVPNKFKTLGWQPTCKCDAGVEPCVVLDPFAGSGTTGAVALEFGRKAILIELNPKYVALIEQRCSTTLGLALA